MCLAPRRGIRRARRGRRRARLTRRAARRRSHGTRLKDAAVAHAPPRRRTPVSLRASRRRHRRHRGNFERRCDLGREKRLDIIQRCGHHLHRNFHRRDMAGEGDASWGKGRRAVQRTEVGREGGGGERKRRWGEKEEVGGEGGEGRAGGEVKGSRCRSAPTGCHRAGGTGLTWHSGRGERVWHGHDNDWKQSRGAAT